MSLSDDHELIVDVVMTVIQRYIYHFDGSTIDENGRIVLGGWLNADTLIANSFLGIKGAGLRADGYIVVEQTAYLLEVGNMKDGKWNHTQSWDGEPVSIIRVGFDGSVSLIRPRHSRFEHVGLPVLMGLMPRFCSSSEEERLRILRDYPLEWPEAA